MIILGRSEAAGSQTIVIGTGNSVLGENNLVIGNMNVVIGENNVVIASDQSIQGDNQTIIGGGALDNLDPDLLQKYTFFKMHKTMNDFLIQPRKPINE